MDGTTFLPAGREGRMEIYRGDFKILLVLIF